MNRRKRLYKFLFGENWSRAMVWEQTQRRRISKAIAFVYRAFHPRSWPKCAWCGKKHDLVTGWFLLRDKERDDGFCSSDCYQEWGSGHELETHSRQNRD